MKKTVHPNFVRASNVIFLTLLTGLVYLIYGDPMHGFTQQQHVIVGCVSLVVLATLALAVRRGIVWVKYLYIVMALLGLANIPTVLQHLEAKPLVGIAMSFQCLLQITAMGLLLATQKEK